MRMSGPDAIQGLFILVLMGISYWWFWSSKERFLKRACVIDRSFKYDVTHTGSMFVPSFDRYMSPGAEVFIPTGDGLYPTRVKQSRGIEYKHGLLNWLKDKHATIHIFITIGADSACQEWQSIKDAYPDQFHLYLLRPERAEGPDKDATKSIIEKLHTFHPALLVNPKDSDQYPGAMWIENNHPVGSKYAYHVEWVFPPDAAHDPRFEQYKHMYEALLKGPHVEEVSATASTQMSGAMAA
jgi:hypothetical protein